MAKAEFVLSAKRNIYKRGRKVQYVSKRGKRAGQTLTKIDRFQPADEGDEVLIRAGESYYTWCFYGGQPIYSKTKPRPSQLTQNPFKSELYSIQEQIEDFAHDGEPANVADFLEEIRESLEELTEQLQEATAGEILQERIDNLDSVISDLESIDMDFESQLDEETDREETETDEDWEQRLEDEKTEWCDEKLGEIQNVDLSFE